MAVQPAVAVGVTVGSPSTLPTSWPEAFTARTWKWYSVLLRPLTVWEVVVAELDGMSIHSR